MHDPPAGPSATAKPDPASILLSVKEACEQLRVGRRTLFMLTRSGRIPYVQIGKSVRYRRASLEQFALECELRSGPRA